MEILDCQGIWDLVHDPKEKATRLLGGKFPNSE